MSWSVGAVKGDVSESLRLGPPVDQFVEDERGGKVCEVKYGEGGEEPEQRVPLALHAMRQALAAAQ